MDTGKDFGVDDFDHLLCEASSLLLCANALENLLFAEAWQGQNCVGFLEPSQVSELAAERIASALDVLRNPGFLPRSVSHEKSLTLLARIGTPGMRIYEGGVDGPVDLWPQPDTVATRSDFLFFHALLRATYIHLKSLLCGREVSDAEIQLLRALMSQLPGMRGEPIKSVEDAKERLFAAWAGQD